MEDNVRYLARCRSNCQIYNFRGFEKNHFLRIGAAVAAGKRASLSKSITSNESKLNEERALQTTHQTRYNDACGRAEKAKLTLIDLTSHKTDINKHIQRLKDVQASSTEALRFVVERKNTITPYSHRPSQHGSIFQPGIPRIDTTKKPIQNFSLRVLSTFWTPRLIGPAPPLLSYSLRFSFAGFLL